MPLLSVDLQDGFEDDHVEVRASSKVILSEDEVRTRTQISLAKRGEAFEFPEGTVRLEVSIPSRGLGVSQDVDLQGDTYVGVNVYSGRIELQVSREPFGYA